MHILLPIAAGVLLSLNLNPHVFALTLRDGSNVQAVLSESNGPIIPPNGMWDEVDISEGWADPRINGGRLLDVSCPSSVQLRLLMQRLPHIPQYTAPLLGEPLNVILSGLSDPYVLTGEGFREYTKSSLFSPSAL